MRIHYILIGAALMTVLGVGCSKSSPKPMVSFKGYKTGSDGVTRATFEFKNSSDLPITCLFQIEPADASSGDTTTIPACGSSTYSMLVKNTNSAALSVTVLRMVPVHKFSVPMQ